MISKKIKITMMVVLFSFMNSLLPNNFCSANQGKSAADAANAKLTFTLTRNKFNDLAKEKEIETGSLSKEMLAHPEKYITRSGAWTELRKIEKTSFIDWYKKETTSLLEAIESQRPEGTRSYFTTEEKESLTKCANTLADAYLKKNFGLTYSSTSTNFSDDREEACKDQYVLLEKNIYPSEVEFDSAVKNNKVENLKNTLSNRMVDKQEKAVFSENRNLLSTNVVEKIIKEANAQLEKQNQTVQRANSGRFYLPEDVKSQIESELKNIQIDSAKTYTHVYGTFPSIKEKTTTKSNKLAVEKFRATISSLNYSIREESIVSLIKSNLQAHVSKNNSQTICQEQFHKAITDKATNDYVGKVSSDKQASLRAFIQKLLASDKSSQNAMENLVAKSLKKNFDNAREKISSEQFNDTFQPLSKETWKPPYGYIDSRYYTQSTKVDNPLAMLSISSKTIDSTKLIEETIEKVLKKEQELISKGLSALRSQVSTVESLQSSVKSEVSSMDTRPTLDKVIDLYTQSVKSSWARSTLSESYSQLFSRTTTEIANRSRAVIKATEPAPPKVKPITITKQPTILSTSPGTASTLSTSSRGPTSAGIGGNPRTSQGSQSKAGNSQGSGSGSGGGAGSGQGSGSGSGGGTGGGAGAGGGAGGGNNGGNEKVVDMIMDFSYKSNKVVTDIIFPKEKREVISLESSIDVDRNSSSLILATTLLKAWLEYSSQNAKEDQEEIKLYVFARVFEGDISYKVVYYFRECLIKALKEVDDERIKIHWRDQLFDEILDIKMYKGKPALPPEFKKDLMQRLA